VLHAITMLELGGAQRNTLDTVRMLDRSRFEVGLVCADRGELLDEARALDDVALFELPQLVREIRPIADLRAFTAIRRAIREFDPDIAHTHSSKAGILGRAAAAAEGVPVIVHSIHGFGFGPHQSLPLRRLLIAAERWAAARTSRFVAVSRRYLDDGVAMGLFARSDAVVIRSGIDLGRFRHPAGGEAVRVELGIPADAPVVLQVACFKPQKAPQRFVTMAARLAARFPEVHFVLVGDGSLRGELESLRARAGLQGRLHLPGWRRDVPAFLDSARVVTLTSRFEGLPRTVVEAMAAGVPVVATAVDGVTEVVRDGVNGFLVAPEDDEGLAARVGELLADEALRARLAAATSTGLDEFDRDRMVRDQEELYEELMSAAAAAANPAQPARVAPAERNRHA